MRPRFLQVPVAVSRESCLASTAQFRSKNMWSLADEMTPQAFGRLDTSLIPVENNIYHLADRFAADTRQAPQPRRAEVISSACRDDSTGEAEFGCLNQAFLEVPHL